MENRDYRFIQVPYIISKITDHYCLQMINILLGIAFETSSDVITKSIAYLQECTKQSKRVINATLSSLHRSGLITVTCVGIGKQKKTNVITINYDKFKEYDNYKLADVLGDDTIRIEIDRYKEKGYRVSYLPIEDNKPEDVTPITHTEVQPFSALTSTEINSYEEYNETDTVSDSVSDTILNDFVKKIECYDNDDMEDVEETPPPPEEIKSTVLSGATAEEMVQDLEKSGYKVNLDCDIDTFYIENGTILNYLNNKYGAIIKPKIKEILNYCTINKNI